MHFSAGADAGLTCAIWHRHRQQIQNVAIYAVDLRGLATGEFGIDQNIIASTDRQYFNSSLETLRTLAINTDGHAIVNRNDLTMGMKQIVRDNGAYYLFAI